MIVSGELPTTIYIQPEIKIALNKKGGWNYFNRNKRKKYESFMHFSIKNVRSDAAVLTVTLFMLFYKHGATSE